MELKDILRLENITPVLQCNGCASAAVISML